MVAHAPTGFVLPYVPKNTQFIGLPEQIPGITEKFTLINKQKLAAYQKLYVLVAASTQQEHAASIKNHYGIDVDYNRCQIIKTIAYPLSLCPARHLE